MCRSYGRSPPGWSRPAPDNSVLSGSGEPAARAARIPMDKLDLSPVRFNLQVKERGAYATDYGRAARRAERDRAPAAAADHRGARARTPARQRARQASGHVETAAV